MAIKIKKNGIVENFVLHSTDVRVVDVADKFKKKDLESVIDEISDTEHIHVGEVDITKNGVWIDDGAVLDNTEGNGVVERLKGYVDTKIKDKWSTISDLTQIGCTTDNTLIDIIKAMPNKSKLAYVIGSSHKGTTLGNQMPSVYGCLYITRVDLSRINIEYICADNGSTMISSNRYVAYYNSTLDKVSEWELVMTSKKMSNENFLINGDFQVWQRGTTISSTNFTYNADRWIYTGGQTYTATKTNEGIKIGRTSTVAKSIYLRQRVPIEDLVKLKGQSITFSATVKGVLSCGLQIYDRTNGSAIAHKAFENLSVNDFTTISLTIDNFTYNSNVQYLEFSIVTSEATANVDYLYVKNAKLELGSMATPFIPKSYSEELLACQRYYQVLPILQIPRSTDTNQFNIETHFVCPMRTVPTYKYLTTMYAHRGDTDTSVVTLCSNINSPEISLTSANAGIVQYGIASISANFTTAKGLTYVLNNSSALDNRLSGTAIISADAEIY